jgi:arylsulfatase
VRKTDGQWELYNLENDRTELHDVIGGEADRAARLRGMYDQWAKRCGVLPRP